MDKKYSKRVNEEAWLICLDWTEVRRFTNKKITNINLELFI